MNGPVLIDKAWKTKAFRTLGLLWIVVGIAFGEQESPRDRLLSQLGGSAPTPLFQRATPLFLDYVETILSKDGRADLYSAADRDDFLNRLERLAGKDLLDLGEALFAFFENRIAGTQSSGWATFEVGPFLVHVRPGSAAESDRVFITESTAGLALKIADAFALRKSFETALKALKPTENGAALIPVYLHSSRAGEGASRIKKGSYGAATLGATIIDQAGKLTFEVHVLYFNVLSLPVLEHEAAHAVLLLSTFDAAALTAKPLKGESDLRQAFFGGYRRLPAFLQEGMGDWAFYYQGFHKGWGLIPSPDALAAGLYARQQALPLRDLLAGDARYAARNRKIFSLQAASFIDFLRRSEGVGKIYDWLHASESDGLKSFVSVFGRPIEAVEKEWRQALRR